MTLIKNKPKLSPSKTAIMDDLKQELATKNLSVEDLRNLFTVGITLLEKDAKRKVDLAKPQRQELQVRTSEEIQKMVERIVAEKITAQYGSRSTHKGPRVSRTYKMDIYLDNWLDAINQTTGIEKSMIVTDSVLAYIREKYMHLKPESAIADQDD